MNRKAFYSSIAVFTLAATLVASSAAAQKGPKKPPGGGEEDAFGNNLSLPAVFVPDSLGGPALRVPCGIAVAPSGSQSTVYPGYWLQKTDATWSADCVEYGATDPHTVPVAADWGDNLTSRPNLPAGKPVRVEVSLLDHSDAPLYNGLLGFVVTNLTPELEDRLATYGTDGTTFLTGAPGAPFTRFFDTGARLTIERPTSPSSRVAVRPQRSWSN